MFGLLKLAFYGLLGWVLYELYQGMQQGSTQRSGGGSRSLRRALNEDQGRMAMSGEGRGTSVSTGEPNGMSMRHTVGRGVTSR